VDEDDLYQAMDWLLDRQDGIETTLAARHLGEGAVARYDLSSSSFENSGCPLAQLGYSRDGRRGKRQVHDGLLTDRRGCQVAAAQRSQAVPRNASTRRLEDGTSAPSVRTLQDELSTIVRSTCRTRGRGDDAPRFEIVTTSNPPQALALELLQAITV